MYWDILTAHLNRTLCLAFAEWKENERTGEKGEERKERIEKNVAIVSLWRLQSCAIRIHTYLSSLYFISLISYTVILIFAKQHLLLLVTV